MTMRMLPRALASVAMGFGLLSAPAASADDFFAGKQIRVVVGASPGGGYDTFARTLAAHWGRHIPGNPGFVIANMPGAGSLVAANHLSNVAERDGTVVGGLNPGLIDHSIMFPDKAKHDPRQLGWIGSILQETQVAIARADSGIQSLDDVFKQELIVAGSGGATVTYPRLLNGLLGTKFRVVTGYPGTNEGFLALERGEVHGNGGTTWASLKATQGALLASGAIIPIAQYGLRPHPELEGVPMVLDYARNDEERAALQLMLARQEFGRPYAAPPGLPAARLTLLRRSFDATMEDPRFKAEIEQRKLDLDPIPGERIQELIEGMYQTPSETVDRVRTIMAER